MRAVDREIDEAIRLIVPTTAVFAPGDVAAAAQLLRQQAVGAALPHDCLAPFAFRPGETALQTGERIAHAYATFPDTPEPSLVSIFAASCDRLGLKVGDRLRLAGIALAVLASVHSSNAYHNVVHAREVLASAVWLIEAQREVATAGAVPGTAALSPRQSIQLLLLAIGHDLGHDGGANGFADEYGQETRAIFRLEDKSFALMEPVLSAAGLTTEEIEASRAMIRATDPEVRPAVRGAISHCLNDGMMSKNADAAPLPPSLAVLASRQDFALMAALLQDADILASAALTHAYHRVQNRRLEQEQGTRFTLDDMLYFFDVIVGPHMASPAGRLLDGNLRLIRSLVARQMQ